MELTDQTFELFAAAHYDNPYCLNKEEFQTDLRLISTLKRMISWMNDQPDMDDQVRIIRLVNNTILFYNVFDHEAATKLLEHSMNEQHKSKINAVLYFLSLPLIYDQEFDLIFHRKIAKVFK